MGFAPAILGALAWFVTTPQPQGFPLLISITGSARAGKMPA